MDSENLLTNARKLRKNMTKQERHLWYDYLKNTDKHWYKQRVIGPYIVDFYCEACRLALELDGSQHYDDARYTYDEERTEYLNEHGITVLRILNKDLDMRFEEVCGLIEEMTSQSACADSSPRRGAKNEAAYAENFPGRGANIRLF